MARTFVAGTVAATREYRREPDPDEDQPRPDAPPQPSNVREVLDAFDAGMKTANEYVSTLDGEAASKTWRLTSNGREVFAIPRAQLLRSIMLNHWYHHRGQLSVYLRIPEPRLPRFGFQDQPNSFESCSTGKRGMTGKQLV